MATTDHDVLDQLVRLFGPKAAQPIDYLEHDWTAEPYSHGCYAAAFGPHGWTELGPALRQPVGPIHRAGAETATAWYGYMDGAVSSGRRAAAEIVTRERSRGASTAAAPASPRPSPTPG